MIHVLKKRFTNSELGEVEIDQKRELNQAQLEPQLASKVLQHGSLSETLKEKLLQTQLLAVGPETELREVAEQLTLLKAVNGLGVGPSDCKYANLCSLLHSHRMVSDEGVAVKDMQKRNILQS